MVFEQGGVKHPRPLTCQATMSRNTGNAANSTTESLFLKHGSPKHLDYTYRCRKPMGGPAPAAPTRWMSVDSDNYSSFCWLKRLMTKGIIDAESLGQVELMKLSPIWTCHRTFGRSPCATFQTCLAVACRPSLLALHNQSISDIFPIPIPPLKDVKVSHFHPHQGACQNTSRFPRVIPWPCMGGRWLLLPVCIALSCYIRPGAAWAPESWDQENQLGGFVDVVWCPNVKHIWVLPDHFYLALLNLNFHRMPPESEGTSHFLNSSPI